MVPWLLLCGTVIAWVALEAREYFGVRSGIAGVLAKMPAGERKQGLLRHPAYLGRRGDVEVYAWENALREDSIMLDLPGNCIVTVGIEGRASATGKGPPELLSVRIHADGTERLGLVRKGDGSMHYWVYPPNGDHAGELFMDADFDGVFDAGSGVRVTREGKRGTASK